MIHDLSEIGARIEAATAKLAGRGIGVVATPIYLSVFRAHSPDLTLVDLSEPHSSRTAAGGGFRLLAYATRRRGGGSLC